MRLFTSACIVLLTSLLGGCNSPVDDIEPEFRPIRYEMDWSIVVDIHPTFAEAFYATSEDGPYETLGEGSILSLELPADAKPQTLYFKFRIEENDSSVFQYEFLPEKAFINSSINLLESMPSAWIEFGEGDYSMIFQTIYNYSCGVKEIRWGYSKDNLNNSIAPNPCRFRDDSEDRTSAVRYVSLNQFERDVYIELQYLDGTSSEVNRFVPAWDSIPEGMIR